MTADPPIKKKSQILVIEDVPADFELIQRELSRGGVAFEAKRVEASDQLFYELQHHPPDLILSDNGLANADSLTILGLVRNRCPDLPFILVTGSLQEELVLKALERGADDCVLKHRLTDLVPAVHRALRLADERRRLRLAEFERDQLRRELAVVRGQHQSFEPLVVICSACKKVRNLRKEWEPVEKYFSGQYGILFSHGLCPQCVESYYTGQA